MYESDDRPGGHANTFTFSAPGKEPVNVDGSVASVLHRSSFPDDRCFHSGFVRRLVAGRPFSVLKCLLSGRVQPRLLPKFPSIPEAVSTSQDLDDEHGFRHLSGPGEI